MGCKTCGCELGRRNKTGYCVKHVSVANVANPEWRAAQRAGIKRKLAHDPEYLNALRKRARIAGSNPAAVEAKTRRFREGNLSQIGNAAQPKGSASRMKSGRTGSATKLAWCPPDLRDQYRYLVRTQHYRAAEAKAMILEQHEREMARFRAKLGQHVPTSIEALEPIQKTPSDTVKAACALLNVTFADVLGSQRDTALVDARAVVAVAMRRHGRSYPVIGRALGRDHTSIIYLCETFDRRAARKPHLAAAVERLAA